MADESTCPDGLPWCTRHVGGTAPLHRSDGKDLPLRERGRDYGNASSYAVQLADYPDSAVVVSVMAGSLLGGTGMAHMDAHDPEFAEAVARFVERLAPATPAQHRALAAQIRSSAAVAFGEAGTHDD